MAGTGREQLEDLLGHKFQSPERLERALTHSSWPSEKSSNSAEEISSKSSQNTSAKLKKISAVVSVNELKMGREKTRVMIMKNSNSWAMQFSQ